MWANIENITPTPNALASSSNRHLFRVPAVSAYKSFHCSWWIHDHENTSLTSLIVSNIVLPVLWYYLCGSQIINTTINSLSYKYLKKFFKEVPDAANINDPSSQLFLLAAGLLGSTLQVFLKVSWLTNKEAKKEIWFNLAPAFYSLTFFRPTFPCRTPLITALGIEGLSSIHRLLLLLTLLLLSSLCQDW